MLVGLVPLGKVGIYGLPFGELTGQKSPLAACAQQVQHGAPHLVLIHRCRLGPPAHPAQQRLYLFELFSTGVACVFFSHPLIFTQ